MTRRSHNGHGWDEGEAFDDALVEELVAGRYEGDIPELVAINQFVERVRTFADQPAPPPSAALARVLSDPAPRRDDPRPMALRRLRDLAVTRSERVGQPVPWPAVAAAAAVLVAAVVAAGSARLLPGPTQGVVANIVRTVTPFGFPEQREPEPPLSKAPSPRTGAGDSGTGARVDDSSPAGAGQRRTDESGTAGGDGDGGRRQSGGVNAAPGPATTALAPRSAPTVPAPNNRLSQGPTASSIPSPPPKPADFTADLSGETATADAGDPDGRGSAALDVRGNDELCLTVVVSGTAPVTAAHLHAGPVGAGGAVVAAFGELAAATSGHCVTVAGQLIKEVRADPGRYYVDVHTTEFPDGALRGQLVS